MSDNTAMLGLTSLLGIGGVLAWMYASQEPVKKRRGRGRGKKWNVDNDEDDENGVGNVEEADQGVSRGVCKRRMEKAMKKAYEKGV